jgi:chromosome segregation ATPase
MADSSTNNRSELAKAESTLQGLETKLEELGALLRERRAQRRDMDAQIQSAAAAGEIDNLMSLQSRTVALDKAIDELVAAEAECEQRIESARRYLYTLYIRLERLRQEAAELAMRISLFEESQSLKGEDLHSLTRVRMQISAITGAE